MYHLRLGLHGAQHDEIPQIHGIVHVHFGCRIYGHKQPGDFGALRSLRVVSQTEVREVPFHPWTLPVGWQMQGCKDSGGGQTFSIVNPEGRSFAACSFPPLVQKFKTCSRAEFDIKT